MEELKKYQKSNLDDALKKDYANFKKMYSSHYPVIKAPNTRDFWDKKFI